MLKEVFQSKLHQAGIACRRDSAECRRTIGKAAVRVREIGVIENVEDLRAELEILVLGKRDLFMQREVPVGKSRAAADCALRAVIELAQRRGLKNLGGEKEPGRGGSQRGIKFPG